jgi:hypothetical protein
VNKPAELGPELVENVVEWRMAIGKERQLANYRCRVLDLVPWRARFCTWVAEMGVIIRR